MRDPLSKRLLASLVDAVVELRHEARTFVHGIALVIVLMASYAVIRTPIESAYLGAYTPGRLPWAWIAVGIGAALVLLVYTRYAVRIPMQQLFIGAAVWWAGILLVLFVGKALAIPGATFALYVAKDLYIVVLVESFWGLSNLLFRRRGARMGYGLFCAAGTLGAFAVNLFIAHLVGAAASAGLEPWVVGVLAIPLILLAAWICARGFAGDTQVAPQSQSLAQGLWGGWQKVRSASYLAPLLGLIGLTQLVITFIDYQYNTVVFELYPGEHNPERAAVMGQVQAAIEGSALTLQILSGVIFSLLGVPRVMVILPLVLISALSSFIFLPIFLTMAAAKVVSKGLDYSLFRTGKEILYLPLSRAQKIQGKAFDMFIYRVAKSGASICYWFWG